MLAFTFMAFASGKESTEGASVKRYIGVAPVTIAAVNPNKEKLAEIYGTNIDKEPEYLSETEGVKSVRIDFIVKTFAEKCNGIEMTTKVAYFIRNEFRYNKDKSKTQVIDKYGRTAWVTKEELASHSIPQYSNGPANLDKDYRQCYVGEEDLTNFIKAYLNIPNVQKYVDGKWILVDKPEDCEARLEDIANYFKGNFKELETLVSLQPNNRVKVLFGVKTNDDNKQFQAAYTQMVLKNNINNYSNLQKDLDERKAAGAYATTEFQVCELKEYNVEATNFGTGEKTEDPFNSTSTEETPW